MLANQWSPILYFFLSQVHAAIRANPAPEKKERKKPAETKKWLTAKLTYDERKSNLKVCLHPIVLTVHTDLI